MSHIRNSPVGRAVAESMPFILPVAILAGTRVSESEEAAVSPLRTASGSMPPQLPHKHPSCIHYIPC